MTRKILDVPAGHSESKLLEMSWFFDGTDAGVKIADARGIYCANIV